MISASFILDTIGAETIVSVAAIYVVYKICVIPRFNLPHVLCFNGLLVIMPDEDSLKNIDGNEAKHVGKRKARAKRGKSVVQKARTVEDRLHTIQWETNRIATGDVTGFGFW